MASKPPVKIVDATVDANELSIDASGNASIAINQVDTAVVIGTNSVPVQGAGADGAAVVGNPNLVAGIDGGGLAQTLSVDATGALNVNTGGVSGTANVEFGATASLAAGASADVDTADIAATTSTLRQVSVASEQPFFFTVSRVENAVVTQVSGEMHGQGGETVFWRTAVDAQLTGGAAGLDAWRVSVTNNDNNKVSVSNVTFEHTT